MTNTPPLTELWQMLRFGLIGLAASMTHILVAALVIMIFSALHEFIVNALAYGVAFSISLVGHQRITFRRSARLWRFVVMSLAGFSINNLVLAGVLGVGVTGLWAIATAVVAAAVASYVLARCWVFIQ